MDNTDGYIIIYNGKMSCDIDINININEENFDETVFFNIKNRELSILKIRMGEHNIGFYHPISGFFFRLVDGKPTQALIDDEDVDNFYYRYATSPTNDIYYSCEIYPTHRLIYHLLDNMRTNLPKLWYYFTNDVNVLYSIPHCLTNYYSFGDSITILMAAAYALNFILVKYLIENMNANIHIISKKGFSVLIYLFHGLEKYCKYKDNNNGESIENFEKILELLLEHGCISDIVYTHKKILYPHSDMLNLYDAISTYKFLSKDILDKIYICMGEPSKYMVKIEEKNYANNYITRQSLR